jgi:protocatechuate 3,4-dioxygenase beta subunit
MEFSEETLVDIVIDSWAKTPDDRLRAVLTSLTRHLHSFVRETEPSQEEYQRGIDFLNQLGSVVEGFVFMSDITGVTTLVDAIDNRRPLGATESSVLGPAYVAGAPQYENGADIALNRQGIPCVVSGAVRDTDGNPVQGAIIDIWQADSDGFYDTWRPDELPEFNLRGQFRSDQEGRYWFRSVVPVSYGGDLPEPLAGLMKATQRAVIRPAHIHVIAGAAGLRPLTTQIYLKGDPALEKDIAFGVKLSLIRPVLDVEDPVRAKEFGVEAPFKLIEFDIVLSAA